MVKKQLAIMDIEEFIGRWENEAGNILIFSANDGNSLKVTFLSGKTGKPVLREFADNSESVDMHAELDYYESSMEIEVCNNKDGFIFSVLHDCNEFEDFTGNYFLAPCFIMASDDHISEKYFHLFEPLENYHRFEESNSKPKQKIKINV